MSTVDIMLVLVILLVVVLIWRGPKMLPRLGEAMGRTVKGVRENLPGAMDEASTDKAENADKADDSTTRS